MVKATRTHIAAALALVTGAALAGVTGVASAGTSCSGTSCGTTQQVAALIGAGELDQAVQVLPANGRADRVRLRTTGKIRGHERWLLHRGHGHSKKKLTGAINPVTVTDQRGGEAGWSLTATFSDFTLGRATIDGSSVRITPRCDATVEGSAPGFTAGPVDQLGDDWVTLCEKDTTQGASGSTGGVYEVNADLAVDLPRGVPEGTFSAIVTLNLS